MSGLIPILNLLTTQGGMEARQISQQLNTPLPLVQAMLQQLERMGRAYPQNSPPPSNCLSGSCKNCPQRQSACSVDLWRCYRPAGRAPGVTSGGLVPGATPGGLATGSISGG